MNKGKDVSLKIFKDILKNKSEVLLGLSLDKARGLKRVGKRGSLLDS
jgi:hypothetical protein